MAIGDVGIALSYRISPGGLTLGIDATADLLATVPIRCRYGIQGGGPTDRVARAGTLTFALNNSSSNEAGLEGYYSPGHANCHAACRIGATVYLDLWDSAGNWRRRFIGRIDSITPQVGPRNTWRTLFTAVDWMDEAAEETVSGIEVQEGQTADQLIATILAAAGTGPDSTDLDTGPDAFPYALDSARDEGTRLLQEFQKIAQSDLGLIYIKGDILYYENRHSRAAKVANDYSFTNGMHGLVVSRSRDALYNQVYTIAHPRKVDSDTDNILYQLYSKPLVKAGQTITIWGGYHNPAEESTRVGGTDMQALVSGTDYICNTAEDGTGTNITSDFTITPTFGGNGVSFAIANNGTVDGYVTTLQCKGRGIYDLQNVTLKSAASAYYDMYGRRVLTYDMPYQSDTNKAQSAADYLKNLYELSGVAPSKLTFVANESATFWDMACNADISTRIGITETVTGLTENVTGGARGWFINGLDFEIRRGGLLTMTWILAPSDSQAVWLLETSALDFDARLGYL